jgi:hypothetical protein
MSLPSPDVNSLPGGEGDIFTGVNTVLTMDKPCLAAVMEQSSSGGMEWRPWSGISGSAFNGDAAFEELWPGRAAETKEQSPVPCSSRQSFVRIDILRWAQVPQRGHQIRSGERTDTRQPIPVG